jgi:hypothetical protein
MNKKTLIYTLSGIALVLVIAGAAFFLGQQVNNKSDSNNTPRNDTQVIETPSPTIPQAIAPGEPNPSAPTQTTPATPATKAPAGEIKNEAPVDDGWKRVEPSTQVDPNTAEG